MQKALMEQAQFNASQDLQKRRNELIDQKSGPYIEAAKAIDGAMAAIIKQQGKSGMRFNVVIAPTPRSTVKTIVERGKRAIEDRELEMEGNVTDPNNPAAVHALREKLQAKDLQNFTNPIEPKGPVTDFVGSTIDFAMPLAVAGAGGVAGGLMAGPLGAAAGTEATWYGMGRGQIFNDLIRNPDMDPRLAMITATVGAVPFALGGRLLSNSVTQGMYKSLADRVMPTVAQRLTNRVKQIGLHHFFGDQAHGEDFFWEVLPEY